MMQRRSILSSLLLVSLLSTFAFSSAVAQSNTASVESKSSQRCAPGVLNVSIDISQDISALELVLATSGDATVTSVTFDASMANLGLRGDVSVPGTIRIYALDTTGGQDCLPIGSHVAAQIAFLTDDVCSGQFTVDGGTAVCDNGVTASSQVVTCDANPDPVTVALTVTGGVVDIVNESPAITCPANQTMHWGEVLTVNAPATDPDEANGCESLTYSLGQNSPGYASITQTGAVILAPQGTDVCVGTVEVIVTDKCGATASCSFDVCVENTPPVAICDSVTNRLCWGLQASGTVNSTDADSGPFPAQYSVVSFDGPGTVNIDPATGAWTWDTQEDAAYIGAFTLTVAVTDGANLCDPCSPENADTCSLDIVVVQTTRLAIETVDPVVQGGAADLAINLEGGYPSYPMAGFDLLIQYDASVLAITGASQGDFLSNNAWEFFTFRFGPNGNCGGGCPTGKFRMVALADLNDGAVAATGYTNTSAGSDQLAVMHFQVSGDRTLQCNFVGVNWCWFDCGDNSISSVTGDSLFISRFVYARDGVFGDGGAGSVDGTDQDFPTQTGAPDVCDVSGGPGKPEPIRKIDFKNGGMKIACSVEIDARGDINLNGVTHEIADAVLFTNYFISGLSVFTVPDAITGALGTGQVQASDVNADGLVLTVADLVYLIRVIVGDALPFGKLAHGSNTAVITTQGRIVSTDVEMGAALFVFNGAADVELLQDGLTIKTGMRDGNTFALIAPEVSETNGASTATIVAGDIVSSNTALLSVEAATLDGSVLNTVTEILPEHFALGQNYPNPFNPSTKINIDLPSASEYSLTIYNVSGQKVQQITGTADAGVVTVEWEASAFASGIYFYKLNAGNFASTKKMLLLK